MVIWESERVLIGSKGKLYTAYAVQYDDGDFAVEVESEDDVDVPAYVYDLAWDHFETCGYFDKVDGDDDGDFGDAA